MQRLHSFETRLECIRLFEEENLTAGKIAKKMGIVHSLVERWLDIYKYNGIEGLKIKTRSPRYDENLKSKIIDQVLVQKIPYTRVASIYNLSSSTVQRWVIQSSEGRKMNGKKKLITTEEAAAIRKKFKHIKDPEIRQIMEKNYWLELENEALKKFQALTQDQQEKK